MVVFSSRAILIIVAIIRGGDAAIFVNINSLLIIVEEFWRLILSDSLQINPLAWIDNHTTRTFFLNMDLRTIYR
jgi:hypothetical protein